MNRKKKTDPSEIIIKVKRRYVRAKKEILVRESKYFQGLCSGNFSDSATTEINLSKVVDDMDIFKSVIDFMATGYIFLSDENIQKVLHFATFLLIDKLQKKSEKYLKENLVCENWLKYHFYAIDNGLSEIQQLTESYVSSRFHDLLIFEDETLQLEPDQVKYLWGRGYMKFCTLNSLSLFITKWLLISSSQHPDEKKFAVALALLEQTQKDVVQTKDEQMVKDLDESIKKLDELVKAENKENGTVDHVMKILRQNVTECEDCDSQTGKTGVVPAKKVTAIFTVSERELLSRKQCEKDIAGDIDDAADDFELSDSDDIDVEFNVDEDLKAKRKLDLCVFNKETDSWYHLGEFDEREYMRQYTNYSYDFTKQYFDDMEFEITACDSHVIFVDKHAFFEAIMYSFKNKKWQHFECRGYLQEEALDWGESIRTMQLKVGRNNMVYLVVCVKIGEEENGNPDFRDAVPMIDIRVYQFDLESLEFSLICRTYPAYNVPECREWERICRDTECHISESRKEMIVAHYEGSGLNVVFTVNLACEEDENGKPKKCEVLNVPEYDDPDPREILKKESDKDNVVFKKVFILEAKDKYLILEHDTCKDSLSLKFSYSFDTGTLTRVENSETYKLYEKESNFIRAARVFDSDMSLCEGNSFWQVEQKLRFGNIFDEVRYNDDGKPEVIKHRPPPITALISVSSAIVDESFFQDLEPVNHLLYMSK